jgi:carbohydrate diacid regulator
VFRLLTREIANEIVKETMSRLNRNINIIDLSGTILATGDPTRVNLFHEGGLEVIKTGRPLVITNDNINQWRGSSLGINIPIEFQSEIVGAIGITGKPEEVEEFGDLVKMTTELLIKQSYIASQENWRQRSKEEIFTHLINPNQHDPYLLQKLELLDVTLQPPFHVFLIELKEGKAQGPLLIKKIEEVVNENHSLVGFLEANKLFVLISSVSSDKAIKRMIIIQEILQRMHTECKISYGTKLNEKELIPFGYKEAEIALRIGIEKENKLISYSDIETEALMFQLDNDLKKRFAERILPNLTPKVLKTLQAFFDCNLNITETANQLFVHRNTLIYRLKRVKEQTGYDPQIFSEAITLQLAIWAVSNG